MNNTLSKVVFISDIHLPDNIPLEPVFNYIRDFKPDTIILGGDIVDGKGMHGVEQMKASDIDVSNYYRDVQLLKIFIAELLAASPKAHLVYLEGNHEERYKRAAKKYPKTFPNVFNFQRDIGLSRLAWIDYGDYNSHFVMGDTFFIHGNIWPDLHAKAYALRYTPFKVVYGHLHHFQAYTTHKATLDMSPRYAVTAGCLTKLAPDWKKGESHQWVNGFISGIFDGKRFIPTIHMIENGMFNVGGKVYK